MKFLIPIFKLISIDHMSIYFEKYGFLKNLIFGPKIFNLVINSIIAIILSSCSSINHGIIYPPFTKDTANVRNYEDQKQDKFFNIPRCNKKHGIIALVESTQQDDMINATTVTNSALRLFIQKSNCFTILDRGFAHLLIANEKLPKLKNREPSIDFVLQARAVYQDMTSNDFSVGMSQSETIDTLSSSKGFNSGLATSNVEVGVVLILTDAKTGIQIASQFGVASKSDISIVSFNSAAFNGFSPSGKTTVAALMDAYQRLISEIEAN